MIFLSQKRTLAPLSRDLHVVVRFWFDFGARIVISERECMCRYLMPAVSRRGRSPEQPAVPGVAEVHDGGARPPVPRAEGELEV